MRRTEQVLGLGLLIGLLLSAGAALAASETPSGGRATLVGTVAAIGPGHTVVVEVPLESQNLIVGASATDQTMVTAAGIPVTLEDVQPGSRVRITFCWVSEGHELLALDVLSAPPDREADPGRTSRFQPWRQA